MGFVRTDPDFNPGPRISGALSRAGARPAPPRGRSDASVVSAGPAVPGHRWGFGPPGPERVHASLLRDYRPALPLEELHLVSQREGQNRRPGRGGVPDRGIGDPGAGRVGEDPAEGADGGDAAARLAPSRPGGAEGGYGVDRECLRPGGPVGAARSGARDGPAVEPRRVQSHRPGPHGH